MPRHLPETFGWVFKALISGLPLTENKNLDLFQKKFNELYSTNYGLQNSFNFKGSNSYNEQRKSPKHILEDSENLFDHHFYYFWYLITLRKHNLNTHTSAESKKRKHIMKPHN